VRRSLQDTGKLRSYIYGHGRRDAYDRNYTVTLLKMGTGGVSRGTDHATASVNGHGPCTTTCRAGGRKCMHPAASSVLLFFGTQVRSPGRWQRQAFWLSLFLNSSGPRCCTRAGVCMEACAKPQPVFDKRLGVHIEPCQKRRPRATDAFA
jgi:hypothetical protein